MAGLRAASRSTTDMRAQKKKARNLRQQVPGRECHREMPNDTLNVSQTRTPHQHHETADTYVHVVARLSSSFRVIVCKDNLQWILQRRDAQRSGQPRWRGVKYCTQRHALIRDSRALEPNIEPAALAILEGLPEQIGWGASSPNELLINAQATEGDEK